MKNAAPKKPQDDSDKRILIIHPEGNATDNPTIRSIIRLLSDKNISIDILSRNKHAPRASLPNVNWLYEADWWWQTKALVINILCSSFVTSLLLSLRWSFSRTHKYELIIGIDRQGLIESSFLSRILSVPFGFISFEIMFKRENSAKFKKIEQHASDGVAFWVAQDEVRAEKLRFENHLDTEKLFILPLSSSGLGLQTKERLRDKLRIPEEKRIAIAIGSISNWTMIGEIICTLPSWPSDWVLLIHDRYGNTKQQLRKLGIDDIRNFEERLYISSDAREDIDELGFIFSGISCGLAFYQPKEGDPYLGDNLRFIGKASGKISTYFRYGIPVITNIEGPIADDIRKHGLGEVVESPCMLPQCLAEGDFLDHGKECQDYFKRELDFDLYADKFWNLIERSARLS